MLSYEHLCFQHLSILGYLPCVWCHICKVNYTIKVGNMVKLHHHLASFTMVHLIWCNFRDTKDNMICEKEFGMLVLETKSFTALLRRFRLLVYFPLIRGKEVGLWNHCAVFALSPVFWANWLKLGMNIMSLEDDPQPPTLPFPSVNKNMAQHTILSCGSDASTIWYWNLKLYMVTSS
jgi:hypothetical protein